MATFQLKFLLYVQYKPQAYTLGCLANDSQASER